MDEYEETNPYLTIQKLYSELDKEKEASATAVTEALNMIFRLQNEIAKQKMEDCQYKRMVEEKTRYSEELLMIFEELLHQKQMEIDSLKFQVKEHVDKLSYIVFNDNTSKVKVTANQFSKESNCPSSQTSANELEIRLDYLPAVETEGLCLTLEGIDGSDGRQGTTHYCGGECRRFSVDLEIPASERYGCFSGQVEEKTENDIKFSCVRGDDTVTDALNGEPLISKQGNSSNGKERCMSFSESLPISYDSYISTIEEVGVKQITRDFNFLIQDGFNSSNLESISHKKASTSMQIQDIFEVPEVCSNLNRLPKLVSSPKSDVSDGRGNNLMDSTLEFVDYSERDGQVKKGILCSFHGTNLQTPAKVTVPADIQPVWYHRNDRPPNLVDSQQFEHRLRKLEDGMKIHYEFLGREEDTKLLREIQEKLNAIESYIYEYESRKNDSQVASSLFSLFEEAVLSFSI